MGDQGQGKEKELVKKSGRTQVLLDELPGKIFDDVTSATRDYAVPIVVETTPLGSGTLVQIDDWLGILTAEHVVNHPHKRDLRLGWPEYPARLLRTGVGEFAHDLSIKTTALRIVSTARGSDEYGPDLAFIALPPGPFLSELKARKSFYNLSLKAALRKKAALADNGFFALCGFPAVRDFAAQPQFGFSETHGLSGHSMFTGPERYERRHDWDYYEMGVSHEVADEFERTFGGVSGGGVWRVHVKRSLGNKPGSEFFSGMTFCGVAFFEIDDIHAQHFVVRAHGPTSIYGRFVDQVRRTLLSLRRIGQFLLTFALIV